MKIEYEQVSMDLGERAGMEQTKAENIISIISIIEAILFAMGEAVEISKLAEVLEMDVKAVKEVLRTMEERYREEDRGIMLTWLEDSVQLCTKPQMYEYLIKMMEY